MATKLAAGKGSMGNRTNAGMANGITDGGFREDWKLDLDDWRTSGYLILTGGTNPIVEVSSSMPRITWAASDSAALLTAFKVDGCAEDINSEFQLIASMKQTGTTDTITITASITIERPGYGTVGPFTATAVLTQGALVTQECVFNFSGKVDSNKLRIEPGDLVALTLTPSAHTTDACYLYGTTFRRARNTALTKTGGTSAQNTSGGNNNFFSNKNQRFIDFSL